MRTSADKVTRISVVVVINDINLNIRVAEPSLVSNRVFLISADRTMMIVWLGWVGMEFIPGCQQG